MQLINPTYIAYFMIKRYYLIGIFLIGLSGLIRGQETPESKTYTALQDSIQKYKKQDIDKFVFFAHKLIELYNKNHDLIKLVDLKRDIANRYIIQGNLKKAEKNIDEAIEIAKKQNDNELLGRLYATKAGIYYYQKNYIPSIQYFSKADSLTNEPLQKFNILRNYAFIKKDIGDYEESLKIFNKIHRKLEGLPGQEQMKLINLLDIINNYWDYLEKYQDHPEYRDSLQHYLELVEQSKTNNEYFKKMLLTTKIFSKINDTTITDLILKQVDSLQQVFWKSNIHNIDPTFYYIKAKYFYLKKEYPKALLYLKKVEELSKKKMGAYDEDVTRLYADIYAAMGNTAKALKKTQQLNRIYRTKEQQRIRVNKVLRDEYDYKTINQKIKQLETKVTEGSHTIQYLLGSLLVLLLIFSYSFWKRKKIKKNYQQVVEQLKHMQASVEKNHFPQPLREPEQPTKIAIYPVVAGDPDAEYVQKGPSMPPESLYRELIKRLDEFVATDAYVGKDVNLEYVAQYIGSNKTYTSGVIRHYYKLGFKEFLNKLRVNYVIEHIRDSNYFDNYSLHGIATEMGYGTAKTFSVAFKQETGLSLGEFVKEARRNRFKDKAVKKK